MLRRLTPPLLQTHPPLVRSFIHTVPQVWASRVKCEAEAQFKSVLSSEFMDVMIPDHSSREGIQAERERNALMRQFCSEGSGGTDQ